jgi:hypothetical protein
MVPMSDAIGAIDSTRRSDMTKQQTVARLVKFGWRWVVVLPKEQAKGIKAGQSITCVKGWGNGPDAERTDVQVTADLYVTKDGEVWCKTDKSGTERVALVPTPRPKDTTPAKVATPAPAPTVTADAATLLAALAQAQGVDPAQLLAQLTSVAPATPAPAPAPASAPKGSRPAKRQQASTTPAPTTATIDDIL